MWKCKKFSIIQILREINSNDFQVGKTAIFTFLQKWNFHSRAILHFHKAEIYQKSKFRASEIVKMAILKDQNVPKMISRKI